MPKSCEVRTRTLASAWSPPASDSVGEVGEPLFCVASTYTFHASFFELELLPRFLKLKFDETESVGPFVVEREERLATTHVCVFVDADHFDPSQSTLRWDQLPVRVPGGAQCAQHSKMAVLVWERCIRLIVSSANLTRQGYRRNREIAGVIDFYDRESSAPRRLILDAIKFLQKLESWARASEAAKERTRTALADIVKLVRSWGSIPADFRPHERPRVVFVAGLPKENGGVDKSPLAQMIRLWGTRKASEVTVITPFVSELDGALDPLFKKLLELPLTRDAIGSLAVPGRRSGSGDKGMVVGLPRNFLSGWAAAWNVKPHEVATFVVPPRRDDEPAVNRDLHAKGILVKGVGTTMLLCGSSNFSPRGMGVGTANAEANLCYLDNADMKRGGMRLEDRVPVDWQKDYCKRPIWPEKGELLEDEQPGRDDPIPDAFLWGVYNQRKAVLEVWVCPSTKFPDEWLLHCDRVAERALVDHHMQPEPPADGRIVLPLAEPASGAHIPALKLVWRDEDGCMRSAMLPVYADNREDLLPPEELRSLTVAAILDCLLSGREPAEWVQAQERLGTAEASEKIAKKLDSLNIVDTSGYLLYRIRRFGAWVDAQGARLLQTAASRQAMEYRLLQDPIGPLSLANALVKEWNEGRGAGDRLATDDRATAVLFSLAEINLMLAHAAREFREASIRCLFEKTIERIERLCEEVAGKCGSLPPNLGEYLEEVKKKTHEHREHQVDGAQGGVTCRYDGPSPMTSSASGA